MGGHVLYAIFLLVICCAGIGAQIDICPLYGNTSTVQDGRCDVENNNAECGFDGGDCCVCTCSDGSYYDCGSNGFTCLDPKVAGVEPSVCVESPSTLISCPAELQREWIVENATQARAFADSARCVGGSFNVTWKGKVVVDETISIFEGTVLNVMGGDANTAIVGDGNNRLFAVINASLHLRNIIVSQGNAMYGGAIAATSGSRLSFSRVVFSNNTASLGGGAIYLTNGSAVTVGEDTVFSNNTASDGGALYITSGSAVWGEGETCFTENAATSGNGGALYVTRGSSTVWTAAPHFLSNTAHNDGGALFLTDHSNAIWSAVSNFTANDAQRNGGALLVEEGSRAVWTSESHFFSNNARDDGGALYVRDGSSVHWTAASQFFSNSAGNNAGALGLSNDCSGVWDATSRFSNNNASQSGGALSIMTNCNAMWTVASDFIANTAGKSGGALIVAVGSIVTWTASSNFSGNSAGVDAGAVLLLDSCSGVWGATSFFSSNNAATWSGGALRLDSKSSVVWTVPSYFHGNSAGGSGGALDMWEDCKATSILSTNTANDKRRSLSSDAASSPDSVFSANSAKIYGGAVFAGTDCTVVWENNVRFINNKADAGGAIFVTNGATTEWNGKTDFISNSANFDGGAVGSRVFESELVNTGNIEESVLILKGDTKFENNTCGGSGGGMALVQSLAVLFNSTNTTFLNNSADVSGGAVYLEGMGVGIHFRDVKFVGNVAPVGGGVHATGSGTTVTGDPKDNTKREKNPTTFDGCSFVRNLAFATGGAVDSVSGQDVFFGTLFKDNTARVGGALRLAGTSSISNCSFNDNISEFGEGPAVHNLGFMSILTSNYFEGNIFDCESGMFLDFNEVRSAA